MNSESFRGAQGWARRLLKALVPLLLLLTSVEIASAASKRLRSVDMLVLTSERIALVAATTDRDSVGTTECRFEVHYSVIERLLGRTSGKGIVCVDECSPAPKRGDSLLVMWHRYTRGDPTDMLLHVQVFNLSQIGFPPALDNHFGVIRAPDSILTAVRSRIAMIRAGHPLGDDRRLGMRDFASGNGSIDEYMPPDSEAEKATYFLSLNVLVYPADADRLPAIMRETEDAMPERRGWAATALAQYPRPEVFSRLQELTHDNVLGVREAALASLKSLGHGDEH